MPQAPPPSLTFDPMFAGAQTASVARANFRRMVSKLNSDAVASISGTEPLGPRLQLSLGDYDAYGGFIRNGRTGTTFSFTIGPVSDATVAALSDVAKDRGRIHLHACGAPLLFELMGLERQAERKVRVVGIIVPGNSHGTVENAF